MKTLISRMLISTTLLCVANVAAAEDVVCPSVATIHKNAGVIDRVHHDGKSSPKRFEGGLEEGTVYSNKQFKSGKKDWDLFAFTRNPEEMFPESLTDKELISQGQKLARTVTTLSDELHVIENKHEYHGCIYSTDNGDYYQFIVALNIKGKAPKKVTSLMTNIAFNK